MNLLSNNVIYSDGRHNAFTSMARWRGRDWIAFRNAQHHRSSDGCVLMISSDDLRSWSDPVEVISTDMDDRDPFVFARDDNLHAVTLSVDYGSYTSKNAFDKEFMPSRRRLTLGAISPDGQTWSSPEQLLPDEHMLWWVQPVGDILYGSVQVRLPIPSEEGEFEFRAELWCGNDARTWRKVSVISDEHKASEVALALCPGERLLAFVRHDDALQNCPELKIASPPYMDWQNLWEFDFRNNGPCLGTIQNTIITASRAFFEDAATPLSSPLLRQRERGMILGVVDIDAGQWKPALTIPHSTGARKGNNPKLDYPDISYASMLDLGGGEFAMSYYEGYKGGPSDIRLAMISL